MSLNLIKYEDKSVMNENASIPNTNKVTAGNSLDNIDIGIESGQARMRGSELTDSNLMTDQFGTGESGNLQPYITCYYWKRVA